ncbi:ATP-binding protein [Campylobacter sp. TTU_617]|uniref:ATP-binding protein n=1 Tax=Campylobacter sp. TTU_617 TaxID=2768148 RepID=UPI0019066318|nr:ATP-binding protein [Campylobacter sp. TTU_617]MBK1971874.1 ATP-binding protein [Campylobacter sp. TTU_617]
MNDVINIKNQDYILNRIKEELLKQKSFILLLGKSGSGKSVLLQKLAKNFKNLKFNGIFKNKEEFEGFLKPYINKKENIVVFLDEISIYDNDFLELIRIYSDLNISFVLSSYKKPLIFKKEHFKSRIHFEFYLKELNLDELRAYISDKFNISLCKSDLKLIKKYYSANLRNIDKVIKSFKEFKNFFKNSKKENYLLKLSLFENNLLG